jgi:hypothetical protein
MLADYMRLVVFAVGLLIGVQVPGFVDQYVKRVGAHEIEAARNFSGFQQTADRYFGGSVGALIEHHEASADPAFKQEAQSIRENYQRLTTLKAELSALQGSLLRQIIQIALHPDREIVEETRSAYTYTVPLNPAAVVCGVTLGALLAILIEAMLMGVWRVLRPARSHYARGVKRP